MYSNLMETPLCMLTCKLFIVYHLQVKTKHIWNKAEGASCKDRELTQHQFITKFHLDNWCEKTPIMPAE